MAIETTECEYILHGETTETVTPGEHAPVDLVCPTETGIMVQVTGLTLPCIDVPPQELEGVKCKEDGENIIVDATVHGIESKTTGACGSAVHDTASTKAK